MQKRKIVGLLVSFSVLALAVLAVFNFQSIYDWYRLQGYDAPAEIAALADDSAMNEQGRRLFYINHPQLNDKTTFQQNCTVTEASIVLGCYVSNRGIYIYNVDDKRLSGIEEVTAAHEMLHVAYERLSDEERARIDNLTEQAYKQPKNERVKDTVEQYRETDPTVVPNELHSILGTEVAKLPAELEAYYQQYFTNRQKVVRLSEKYEKAFTQREEKITQYDKQLSASEQLINANKTELSLQEQALAAQRQAMEQLRAQDRITAYNNAVESYNAAVATYNRLLETVKADIAEYNEIVKKRNDLALEESDLYKALDSRDVAPATN